jgi:MFS family permease
MSTATNPQTTDVSTRRPTRVRYIVLAFLCVLAFLTYFDRVCIASAQDDIKADLHLTGQQMGYILGGFWFTYALFEIPGGWMGDRFGSRKTLSRIVLAWSFFTALSGSAMGFASLFTCRLLFGAGEAGAFPNMARVQSRWFPRSAQGRIGGLLWMVSRWGGALSYLLFPSLIVALNSKPARHFLASIPLLDHFAAAPAWRMAFWVCGLVGIVWVLLFFTWFRDDPAQKPGVNPAELALITADRRETVHAHERLDARTWRALFSSRHLWGIALAYMCGSFGWSFFVSWMKPYLAETHHPTPALQNWLNTLPLLVGGATCIVGGLLTDALLKRTGRPRFSRALFPACGFAIAAISMACIPFAPTAGTAVALMCLGSFGNDLGQAGEWASVISIGGRYAGTAFGFINMIANIVGNTLQPVIGDHIKSHYGWPPLFAVYGAVFLTASILWLFINPTKRFYEK